MQSLSKLNKGFKYLLCAIDLFSKYAWVIPIKDEKVTSIVNASRKIISEGRKPNKLWIDQGSEFYNQSFITGNASAQFHNSCKVINFC